MKNERPVPPDLAAALITALAKQLILDGDINPKGKNTSAIQKELRTWLAKHRENLEFTLTIDHTSTIWDLGKDAELKGNSEYACLYYATWAEHQLNQIVVSLCNRRGFEQGVAQVLIRDTGFRAKFLWIHCLLRRSPNKAILDSLNTLSEFRNQLVHYKWKAKDDQADERCAEALKKAHVGLSYLNHLIDEKLLSGSKRQLDSLKKSLHKTFTKKPLQS